MGVRASRYMQIESRVDRGWNDRTSALSSARRRRRTIRWTFLSFACQHNLLEIARRKRIQKTVASSRNNDERFTLSAGIE